MTVDKVRELLASECARLGSQAVWADANDLSAAYVSDVIRGRRDPGAAILKALGLECKAVYHRV